MTRSGGFGIILRQEEQIEMTQLEAARRGDITEAMKVVAADEKVSETSAEGVAEPVTAATSRV